MRSVPVPEAAAHGPRNLQALTSKPILYVANVDEGDVEGTGPLVQAVRAAAAKAGAEVVTPVAAWANPSGPVDGNAYDRICEAICNAVARLHEGRLQARNEGGACFTLWLPQPAAIVPPPEVP